MRSYPDTLINIIEESDLNLNQISKISGISNTYLTKLLKKKINHPGKDKITSVLLSLNHTITQINQILADYDYRPLNHHDIPAILKNNRRRKFEGRIVPHFDYIYFELVMAAMESIGGTKIIIKNRPSGIFIPMELYMMKEFPTETDSEAARFFITFTHDVVAERKALFQENHGKGYRYESYICQGCFEDILEKNIGFKAQKESAYKVELYTKYIANAVAATLKFPDQHIHQVVKRCTYFQAQIQDADGKNPKVSFTSTRKHYYNKEWEQLNIVGFLSDAPGILDVFFNEVEKYRTGVDQADNITASKRFYSYIKKMFDAYNLGSQFDNALAHLMDYPGFKLY